MNHIDASETANWDGGSGFAPIGTWDEAAFSDQFAFKGVFDGNGFAIRNLNINRTDQTYIGLFGCVSGGKIINLGVESGNIAGNNHIGGLAGGTYSTATILKCYCTATVAGNEYVGGLIGLCDYGAAITNCHYMGAVSGINKVGGLIGVAYGTRTIYQCTAIVDVFATGLETGGLVGELNGCKARDCHASGTVFSTGNSVGGLVGIARESAEIWRSFAACTVTGFNNVGGLVGKFWNSAAVYNCAASGNVSGNNSIGGLVGGTDYFSLVDNSYASGAVDGIKYVGGLVGGLGFTGVQKCYACGSVSGTQMAGGLVGSSNGNVPVWSYWDRETTGQANSSKSASFYGKTTSEMKLQSTYEGWDFGAVWSMEEGMGYPFQPALRLAEKPVILRQPKAAVAKTNTAVVLDVLASSPAPLTYQWLKDGAIIGQANEPTLNLVNISQKDEGTYQVWIESSYGLTVSSPVAVKIESSVIPRPVFQPAGIILNNGGSVQLTIGGTKGTTYEIQQTTNFLQWTQLKIVTAEENTITVIDTNSMWKQKYYRIVVQ